MLVRPNLLVTNFTIACAATSLYLLSYVPPLTISVAIMLALVGMFLKGGFNGRVYSYIGVVFCVLPLLHTIGFVLSDSYAFYPSFLVSYSDQLNPDLRARLALLGLITMSGLMSGAIAGLGLVSSNVAASEHEPSGSLLTVMLLSGASLVLIHIDAPEMTIFLAAYTESLSMSSTHSLGSLFPVSFGLNLMAWYVYCEMPACREKTYSLLVLLFATLMTIVFYQLLRGDREFVGLLIGLLFLADRYSDIHKRTTMLILVPLLMFLVLQFVGFYRSVAVEHVQLGDAIATYFGDGGVFHGTWTAVLLTPLATIGDFYLGERNYLLGKTYLDYLLSIPPTPVADFFGYQRPITSEQGPSWEMSYGVGGTYIAVVPLLNFGMIGVLVQTCLFGFLLGAIDKKAMTNSPVWVLFGFAVAVVLWGVLWYGEMYLLRAIVTTFPLLLLTRFVIGMLQRRSAHASKEQEIPSAL